MFKHLTWIQNLNRTPEINNKSHLLIPEAFTIAPLTRNDKYPHVEGGKKKSTLTSVTTEFLEIITGNTAPGLTTQ